MKARVGTAVVAGFFVSCPGCGYGVLCPRTGSFLLTQESVLAFGGKPAECFGCGAAVKLPPKVLKLGYR